MTMIPAVSVEEFDTKSVYCSTSAHLIRETSFYYHPAQILSGMIMGIITPLTRGLVKQWELSGKS